MSCGTDELRNYAPMQRCGMFPAGHGLSASGQSFQVDGWAHPDPDRDPYGTEELR